jgi:hypothetical protein
MDGDRASFGDVPIIPLYQGISPPSSRNLPVGGSLIVASFTAMAAP